ncbi:MAG: hypothetical protein JNL50_10895 [Phycisphaerae bacterium]|nr:hypothetical protein [Phycisphaerae bacterium]
MRRRPVPRLPAAQLRGDRTLGTWLLLGYVAAFLAAAALAHFAGGTIVAISLIAMLPATLPLGLLWAMSRRHKDLARRIARHHGLICPECEYPLDHRDSDRCPECGRVASDEQVRGAWRDAGLFEGKTRGEHRLPG